MYKNEKSPYLLARNTEVLPREMIRCVGFALKCSSTVPFATAERVHWDSHLEGNLTVPVTSVRHSYPLTQQF